MRSKTYEFTLFSAGRDDCTFCFGPDRTYAGIAREAAWLESAIASAISDAHQAGLAVDRVSIDGEQALSLKCA